MSLNFEGSSPNIICIRKDHTCEESKDRVVIVRVKPGKRRQVCTVQARDRYNHMTAAKVALEHKVIEE